MVFLLRVAMAGALFLLAFRIFARIPQLAAFYHYAPLLIVVPATPWAVISLTAGVLLGVGLRTQIVALLLFVLAAFLGVASLAEQPNAWFIAMCSTVAAGLLIIANQAGGWLSIDGLHTEQRHAAALEQLACMRNAGVAEREPGREPSSETAIATA